MEELKLSTKLLLVSGLVLLVVLLSGPLGYQWEWLSLAASFNSLLVALVGGWLLGLGSLVCLVLCARGAPGGSKNRNRNFLLLTLVMGLVPSLFMVPQLIIGRSVPAIHDITTDTFNPPQFQAITGLRQDARVYGASEQWPPEKLRAAQQAAYPQVQTFSTELPVPAAVKRAEDTLIEMGLALVAVDPVQGMLEATASSYWFGFKDDLVVRIQASDSGSRIDLRSVSRVGQSDLGVNAARIMAFQKQFQAPQSLDD